MKFISKWKSLPYTGFLHTFLENKDLKIIEILRYIVSQVKCIFQWWAHLPVVNTEHFNTEKLLLCCCSAQVEYIGGMVVEVLCRKQSGDQPPTFLFLRWFPSSSCLLFLCVLHWLNSHWIEDPCFFFRHFGVTLARSLRLIFCGRKKNCYECCFQCLFINCWTSKPVKILLYTLYKRPWKAPHFPT